MAETFLGPVIEKLVELSYEEVKSLKGVHEGFESLRYKLEIIQWLLKDADARLDKGEDTSDTLKTWVKQVREEAYHIEDIIDECLCYVAGHRHQDQRKILRFFRRISFLIQSLKRRQDIVSELQNCNRSLSKIKGRAETFGLRPLLEQESSSRSPTNVEGHDPRLGSLSIEEDELVEIESLSKELTGKLVKGTSTRSVISLVGEGGIGKTTLAKRVYNDEVVKGNFDCHAWITVSQSYNPEKLLLAMKSQICPTVEYTLGEFNIEGLIIHLRQYLQTKRYIIVFDDVWKEDLWEIMKYALPSSNNNSRIIITTRNHTIANSCEEAPSDFILELKIWPPERAFELFCKKAFRHEPFRGRCPEELEQLSRDIVSKCHGLPLVIATIASLLSTKEKVELEWQKVLDNLNFRIYQNDRKLTRTSKILSLSYHDLPYHLKSCFLYFGVFPEDYCIIDSVLYQMWIAEGFVKAKEGKTLEQVAEECLNNLINRNLILFAKYGAEEARVCRVHDLMHEIILSKADEWDFCQIMDGEKSIKSTGRVRRLSIQGNVENVLETIEDSGLRSVFLFGFDTLTETFMANLFKKFKLLKVLHIESCSFPQDFNFPKEVGKLFHLKCLCWFDIPKVKAFPNSIGKLYNLRTLCLSRTDICELPVEINNIQNFRHLYLTYADSSFYQNPYKYTGLRIKEGIGKLENLQALELVHVQPGVVNELKCLVQLRTLRLAKLTKEMGRDVCASVEKMKCLETLTLISANADEVLDLEYISSPPPNLKFLCLFGRLPKFFDWIQESQNLQLLGLYDSRLIESPLSRLKDLPNLAKLILYNAYDGAELHFEEGSFRKLRHLALMCLKELKVMKTDVGALPLLERLYLWHNPLMDEVPSDLQSLGNLKSLDIVDISKELVMRIQPSDGPDNFKIKHVPLVYIGFSESNVMYKLGDPDLLEYLQAAS
ncbi:NB-ARC domain, LRR domain containing protein [Trema orientale]|uniref:NB-ARC domain, LRR domain containing protein n=1 Tax=Trema orientale TaxID=63057 RepID=A0A2P5CXN8_TREOI|nr:NB-ARC domain, LRR domain containing protein [Trema orientale]